MRSACNDRRAAPLSMDCTSSACCSSSGNGIGASMAVPGRTPASWLAPREPITAVRACLLLVTLWTLALRTSAVTLQIVPDPSSSFALPPPDEPKLVVLLHGKEGSHAPGGSADSSSSSGSSGSDGDKGEGRSSQEQRLAAEAAAGPANGVRMMTDAQGNTYSCAFPNTASAGAAAGYALAAQQQQAADTPSSIFGDTVPQKNPFELLEAMSSLCLYRQDGLWTYEMCYKKQTRQFRHETVGSTTSKGDKAEDFSCGKYAGDEVQQRTVLDDASSSPIPIRYVSHVFKGGAECVLTGRPRSAEVRFTCLPDTTENTLVSVKEFPTCNYVYIVSTPFLCKHPLFKPKPERVFGINCQLIKAAPPPEPAAAAAAAAATDSTTDSQGGGAADSERVMFSGDTEGVMLRFGAVPVDGEAERGAPAADAGAELAAARSREAESPPSLHDGDSAADKPQQKGNSGGGGAASGDPAGTDRKDDEDDGDDELEGASEDEYLSWMEDDDDDDDDGDSSGGGVGAQAGDDDEDDDRDEL